MPKKRILILGAGLAGLSAAYHLQKFGRDFLIFEKESEPGGLCRSKNISGFTFDYDGHLLHFKHRYAFELVKDLLGNNLCEHQRSAWVYSCDRYVRYPFQANLHGLPPKIINECLLGFIQTLKNGRLKKTKNLGFLEWVNQNFGKGIARHFMAPYNRKFWTLPPQELTTEWVDGFIPVFSLNQIIEGAIQESQRQFGYNARFWYPKTGGINQLPLALVRSIKNIYTDCQIVQIDLRQKLLKTSSGEKEKYDYLISTIPLPEMFGLIQGLPKGVQSSFKRLRWNSIFNLNLGIEGKDYSNRHWVYFPQDDISFFRVGFYHNFSSGLTHQDKSALYVEVSYSKHKPVDKNRIVLKVIEDLKKVGLLRKQEKISCQDINDIQYGYPIYDQYYRLARQKILAFLHKNNILCCGRYGSWRYMSMEDTILDAKQIVENLKQ